MLIGFNFHIVMIVLWLCMRMSLSLDNTQWNLGSEEHLFAAYFQKVNVGI